MPAWRQRPDNVLVSQFPQSLNSSLFPHHHHDPEEIRKKRQPVLCRQRVAHWDEVARIRREEHAVLCLAISDTVLSGTEAMRSLTRARQCAAPDMIRRSKGWMRPAYFVISAKPNMNLMAVRQSTQRPRLASEVCASAGFSAVRFSMHNAFAAASAADGRCEHIAAIAVRVACSCAAILPWIDDCLRDGQTTRQGRFKISGV